MTGWLCKGMVAAVITLPMLLNGTPARADLCSNATLKGDYGTRISGKLISMTTAAGPQFFSDPFLIDGVAMVYFDGKGNFTQVDYVLNNGVPNPGPKDPKTGFGINESGQYTVFPDCTGQSVLSPNPIVKIEVKFVLVDEGRQTYGIESRHSVVPVGTSFVGIVCDLPAGCAILPHLHADSTKLK